jgi:hypothetical protein
MWLPIWYPLFLATLSAGQHLTVNTHLTELVHLPAKRTSSTGSQAHLTATMHLTAIMHLYEIIYLPVLRYKPVKPPLFFPLKRDQQAKPLYKSTNKNAFNLIIKIKIKAMIKVTLKK